jgi:1-acyl-sn-glycerol-3-phosphate acyltransferase
VPSHPANLHRLLFDEGQLVLAFPEGASGPRKPLKDRYRIRRFHRPELIAAAVRANAPIVPVALVGAEEAQPVITRVSPLGRLPSLPLTPPLPLPAKFRVRFLEPVDTAELSAAADHKALVQALSHDVRALIQENLFEMVAARRSVWLG